MISRSVYKDKHKTGQESSKFAARELLQGIDYDDETSYTYVVRAAPPVA